MWHLVEGVWHLEVVVEGVWHLEMAVVCVCP